MHCSEEGGPAPKHNIILEYGESDLDEYLAETCPPVLATEIINFWQEIFKLALTIRDMHTVKYTSTDGKVLGDFKG